MILFVLHVPWIFYLAFVDVLKNSLNIPAYLAFRFANEHIFSLESNQDMLLMKFSSNLKLLKVNNFH